MNRWVSFIDYLLMEEMGNYDSVYRNYAIDCWRNKTPMPNPSNLKADGVRLALKRIGVESGDRASMGFDEVKARLRGMGYETADSILMIYLQQWYNWDRIRTGEIQTWPYKRKAPLAA